MKRHTLLIQLAGQKNYVHYVLSPYETVCGGEDLNNSQFKLVYDIEDHDLCPACKESEPVPSVKDWTFTKPIKNKNQASLSINLLHIFFQMLEREVRICQSLKESEMFGSCDLTLFLTDNDEPKIETIKDGNLLISYGENNKRVKRTVSYQRVGMVMKNVKKDLLTELHIKRN